MYLGNHTEGATQSDSHCERLVARCGVLREAIDFFSQSLHLEQLMYYGHELVHKSLELNQSALFIIEDTLYDLKKSIGYTLDSYTETADARHQDLARFFGRVLTQDFERYFSEGLVSVFQTKLIIPIIVKDELVGFIISDGKIDEDFSEDDLAFTFSINQLMNKAFENARAFKSLEEKNLELDKRVFNLFFINHCSRLLLSELNLNNLYTLCVDVIRELTASAVTTFFVWDDLTEKLVLKGYKNILSFDQIYGELKLITTKPATTKIVYHIQDDKAELEAIFGGLDIFSPYNAEHVILVVKDTIIGVVTVSTPVNEKIYDKQVLDMIVSVANSINIAITNAHNFEEIRSQKNTLALRLSHLEQLNRAIKNINSCQSIEDLCEITISTLLYAFDVNQAGIFLREETDYRLKGSVGWQDTSKSLLTLLNQVTTHGIVDYERDGYTKFVRDIRDDQWHDSSCFVLLPIQLDLISPNNEGTVGYLLVNRLNHPLKKEDVLVFEALTNAIAPIISQMNAQEHLKRTLIDNPLVRFENLLQNAATHFELYGLNYTAYLRKHSFNPFAQANQLQENQVQLGEYLIEIAVEKQCLGYEYEVEGGDYISTYDNIRAAIELYA